MELRSFQSLFGLHVQCVQLHSLAKTPKPPPPLPPHLGSYTRTLLGSQERRNLFVTHWANESFLVNALIRWTTGGWGLGESSIYITFRFCPTQNFYLNSLFSFPKRKLRVNRDSLEKSTWGKEAEKKWKHWETVITGTLSLFVFPL